MQFGKFHGILFVVLGLMLTGAQAFMMFREAHQARIDPHHDSVAAEPKPAQTMYIAGISGLISLGIGTYLLLQKRENVSRTT
jgi:hypothetical protein